MHSKSVKRTCVTVTGTLVHFPESETSLIGVFCDNEHKRLICALSG